MRQLSAGSGQATGITNIGFNQVDTATLVNTGGFSRSPRANITNETESPSGSASESPSPSTVTQQANDNGQNVLTSVDT
jgi:hypothetical protein